jgi:hypothetical protein
MRKLKRPGNLVGYFFGEPGTARRPLRPAVFALGAATAASLALLVWTSVRREPLEVTVSAASGFAPRRAPDGRAYNAYDVTFENRGRVPLDLRLELTGPRSEEQEAALRALEAGPQTFCHLDFYPENLFGVGAEPILVDWAYCGIGALGEDPGNFVPDTLGEGLLAAEQADELERAVWDGYRAGLTDAGWAGDEREVRFAFCAAPWLKYQWVRPRLASRTLDEATQAHLRGALPLIDRLGEEARELASLA